LEADYDISNHILGSGQAGDVKLATSRAVTRKVAVKTFDLRKVAEQGHTELLLNEVELYLSVDHPHIARLLDVYETKTHLHLVMECVDGGELFDQLLAKKP
jgi:serine/threonine protein kinase